MWPYWPVNTIALPAGRQVLDISNHSPGLEK
jgi:hypothetical protein